MGGPPLILQDFASTLPGGLWIRLQCSGERGKGLFHLGTFVEALGILDDVGHVKITEGKFQWCSLGIGPVQNGHLRPRHPIIVLTSQPRGDGS